MAFVWPQCEYFIRCSEICYNRPNGLAKNDRAIQVSVIASSTVLTCVYKIAYTYVYLNLTSLWVL